MRFMSAAALWWLLPVFGAILLLYLLKMRRIDVKVPATFLWPQCTSDIRANAPFQRLRLSTLLILQLLAAGLIIFALAGPLHSAKGLAGHATIVVVDDSASMQATDVAPTRFGHALSLVRSLIDSLKPSDRFSVIVAGAETRILFPLTNDKAQMERALETASPSDSPAQMGDALRLAAALAENRPSSRIIVYSDGSFPAVIDFSPGQAQLSFATIGSSSKNVAITSFNSSLTPTGTLQCFGELHNYDSEPMTVQAVFKLDGSVADARELTLGAEQSTYLTFDAAPTARKAQLTVEAPGDILAADNQATIFMKGVGTVRTLLVTSGNLFLENALSLDPAVRLERSDSVPDYERQGTPGAGRYDLVVFDNVPPCPVKSASVWSLGVPSQDFGVTNVGIALRPRIVDCSRNDPVMRFSDLSNLMIARSHVVKLRDSSGAATLASSIDGPMIVSRAAGGQRFLYNSWSVLDSDFPLQVSFPIFVSNAVEWLTSGTQKSAEGGGITAACGQPITIATNDNTVQIIDPSGNKETVQATNGAVAIPATGLVGTYRVRGAQTDVSIAVNLLNEDASNVRPIDIIHVSGSTVSATTENETVVSEFWRAIVIAVLLIMAVEWWLFSRNS